MIESTTTKPEPTKSPTVVAANSPLPTNAATEVHLQLVQHVILPAIILLVGAAGLYGFAKLKPDPPRKEIPPFIPTVETVEVAPFDGKITLDADGTVVPFREIMISSEISGRIKTKPPECRAGNFVTKGTLLFEIDPIDFQLEVRRLKQEVEQAKSSVAELDVELENYQQLVGLAAEDRNLQLREVERLKSLVSNKTVTLSELDQALGAEVVKRNALQVLANRLKVLVPRRAALEAALELAKTGLEKAQLDLKRTRIFSPVDGVIVGDLFEENSFVSRGTTLTAMEETSSVEVRCNLRTDQLFWLWGNRRTDGNLAVTYEIPAAKTKVVFRLGDREYEWDGVLSRYEGTGLDVRTRTIPCRVLVTEPARGRLRNSSPGLGPTGDAPALVRGMFVHLQIETNVESSLLKIPIAAQQLGGTVWKADGRTLRVTPVKVAKTMRQHVLVDTAGSSISPGDKLIITSIAKVEDGMEIQFAADNATATAAAAPQQSDGPVAEAPVDNESY